MASRLEVPDDWGFSGKVAVVMGGGAAGSGVGNGRAAAILLARAGAQVIVVDRTIDLAEQTVLMIREQGSEALALEADITRSEDCAMVVKTALDHFGRLRHVVPAAQLSETPAFWSRPTVPLGTHPAAWPA